MSTSLTLASAATTDHPEGVGPPESQTSSSALALLGGGLAGLLAGIDAILLIFLLVMLGGSSGSDLVVAGVGHAGWSAARGVELGVELGGVLILLGTMLAGAAAARWLTYRRSRSRSRSSGFRSRRTA